MKSHFYSLRRKARMHSNNNNYICRVLLSQQNLSRRNIRLLGLTYVNRRNSIYVSVPIYIETYVLYFLPIICTNLIDTACLTEVNKKTNLIIDLSYNKSIIKVSRQE